MTEKRFYTDGQYVMQNKEVYVICSGEHNADVVATALNESLEENKQLKIQLQNISAQRDEFHHGARENANRVGKLKKENEQLKQAYQTLKSRHSLLHDECLEAECDRDSLKKDVISLEKENEQLKKALQEVYNDDDYLKQFIIAIINNYSRNGSVSPIRLEMIWDSLDMDKTSLKYLKSSFYE